MARIRSIKPTFWTDEKIGELTVHERFTFLGLISALADDHGRLSGVPKIIRGAVYPFDESVTTDMVEGYLATLHRVKLIRRYVVNGAHFIQITNWTKHQRVDKPANSLLPSADDANAVDLDVATTSASSTINPRINAESLADDSENIRRAKPTDRDRDRDRDREGDMERERSGADARAHDAPIRTRDLPPLPSSPNDSPAPDTATARSAPLADAEPLTAPGLHDLPIDAVRLVERFYPPALHSAKLAELAATLTPRGATLKGRTVVAGSPDRLGQKCRIVMENPPRDSLAAVAIVLAKLGDPTDEIREREQRLAAEKRGYLEESEPVIAPPVVGIPAPTERELAGAIEAEWLEDVKPLVAAWVAAHPDDADALEATIMRDMAVPIRERWSPGLRIRQAITYEVARRLATLGVVPSPVSATSATSATNARTG